MTSACAAKSRGENKPGLLCHALAVNENGSDDRPNTPMSRPRLSHVLWMEVRKRAPPIKRREHPHATEPAEFPLNAEAIESAASVINQYGRPLNSSEVRSHIHAPYKATTVVSARNKEVGNAVKLAAGMCDNKERLAAAETSRRDAPNPPCRLDSDE